MISAQYIKHVRGLKDQTDNEEIKEELEKYADILDGWYGDELYSRMKDEGLDRM